LLIKKKTQGKGEPSLNKKKAPSNRGAQLGGLPDPRREGGEKNWKRIGEKGGWQNFKSSNGERGEDKLRLNETQLKGAPMRKILGGSKRKKK